MGEAASSRRHVGVARSSKWNNLDAKLPPIFDCRRQGSPIAPWQNWFHRLSCWHREALPECLTPKLLQEKKIRQRCRPNRHTQAASRCGHMGGARSFRLTYLDDKPPPLFQCRRHKKISPRRTDRTRADVLLCLSPAEVLPPWVGRRHPAASEPAGWIIRAPTDSSARPGSTRYRRPPSGGSWTP